MAYKNVGSIKQRGNSPRHNEHNAKGSSENPFGKSESKAELLAWMKVAAELRKEKNNFTAVFS